MRSRLALAAVFLLSIGIAVPAQGPGQGPGQVPIPGMPGGQRTPPRVPGMPGTQEEAPTGTAVLRGFVVALDSGAPIRRAQVRAMAPEARTPRMTTTDGDGRFELRELPAGRYRIFVTKSGFVSLQYGQRRPSQSGTPIEIRDKQVIDKVTIGLPRGSVIAGRITDDFGEPVAGANVNALQSRFLGGTRRWTPSGQGDRTDDLGQFRLYGLAPGDYVVSATYQMMGMMDGEQSPEATGFAPTYFPGVPGMGDAQRITVAVGEENTNASFALVPTRLVSVEGTVTSAEGKAITQGFVTLMPADPSGAGIMMFMSGGMGGRIDNSGKFRIGNVAPGNYIAQARVGGNFGPEGPGEIGRMPVAVGSEKVENVAIVMTTGGRITGRVVTDTGEPLPTTSGPMEMSVMARPAAGAEFGMGAGGGFARVNADGTFELRGLVDPRVIRVMSPSRWIVKAVMAGGRDYADTPIEVQPGKTITGMEIVLTNRAGSVTGAVTDERGQPVLDTSILVFPDDRRLWQFDSRYVKTTRPDQEGRYRIDGLPPADAYLVIAVQDLEDGRSGDPAYLATVRDVATPFSLREAEAKTIDLKLRP
jgi:hypothetical protein